MISRNPPAAGTKNNHTRIVVGVGALLFLVQFGLYVGAPGVEGLFLTNYGTEILRIMYIVVGVAVPLTVMMTGAAVIRLQRRALYRMIPLAIFVLLVASRLILVQSPMWFYPVLYVLMNVLSTLSAFFSWGIAGAVCNARQAKRLFPYFAAGGILGSSVGGLLTPVLVRSIGTANLVLVWAVAMAGALFLAGWLTRTLPRQPLAKRRRIGPIASIQSGYRNLSASKLLPLFASMAAIMVAVYFLVLYPFSRLSVERFPDDKSLAAFFGLFQGVATATGLVISLLISKRLYARFGFLGSLAGYAIVFLVGFVISGLMPLFGPVVIFRYVQISVYLGVAGPAYQAVFNVIPARSREQTRLFIDGVFTQVGMILAGGLLLILDLFPGLTFHFLAGALLSACAAILAIAAKSVYGGAILSALKAGGGAIFDYAPSVAKANDPRAVEITIEALRNGDVATRRAAASVSRSLDAAGVANALVEALEDDDAEVRRQAVLSLASGGRSEALLEIQNSLLDDVADVRRAAVEAIADLAPYRNGLFRIMEEMVADSDPSVAAAAAISLLSNGGTDRGRECIENLLDSGNPSLMTIALKAYQSFPDLMPVDVIAVLLKSSDASIRAAAARVIVNARPAPPMVAIIELLLDSEPSVAHSARDALADAGKTAVGALLDVLESDAHAAVGIDEKILDVLSDMEGVSEKDRLAEYANRCGERLRWYNNHIRTLTAAANGPRRVVDALADCSRRTALLFARARALVLGRYNHFTFEGLASPDSEERAYALEAIDSILDRRSAELALPVLDGSNNLPKSSASGMLAITKERVSDLVASGDPWLTACVIHELPDRLDAAWLQSCRDSESLLVRDAANRIEGIGGTVNQDTTIPMVERVIILRKTPIFAKLTPLDLESVAAECEELDYNPGETITIEGEPGDRMFLIVEGSVKIVVGDEKKEIAIRRQGDAIGEMALISHRPRIATMIAAETVKTLELEHRAFEQILRRSPDVSLAVMQVLCDRLTEASEQRATVPVEA